jgi:WD40 repeat protein
VSGHSFVRVLIATTEGPREVLSLDKAGLKSYAVCSADRTREIANFSYSYHRFVSRPDGGAIGSLYGCDYFRLILSDTIDAGDSWQLGIFVAHALYAAGCLSRRLKDGGAKADTVLFVTGAVDIRDLSVRSVGAVERKLSKALKSLREAVEAGHRVIVMWPSANREDAATKIDELQECGIECVEVETVGAALAALGLELSDTAISQIRRRWPGSPFRGLEAFDAGHREIFFGRGRAREEALEALRAAASRGCAFLLVHGSSGVGKSSLARAGLLGDIAQLTSEADSWRCAIVSPDSNLKAPTAILANALLRAVPELKLSRDALVDAMLERAVGATTAVTTALAAAQEGRNVKLVIVVDQLEQFLLDVPDRAEEEAAREREAFSEILARLARSGLVWIVATMRTDLSTLLEGSPALFRLTSNGVEYRLERPTAGELREIVLRPAELAGLSFEGQDETGLPFQHALVEAAAREPDSLPLLELVLSRLYQEEGCRTRKLSFEVYDKKVGRLEGAIGRLADDTINVLGDDPETEKGVESALLRLGRYDNDAGALVARVVVLDPEYPEDEKPRWRRVIDALVDARLVIRDTVGGETIVRVAHESVLTHWERARQVFADNQALIALRDRLEDDAAKTDVGTHFIPPGRGLEEARSFLSDSRIDLTQKARDYVLFSINKARKEADAEHLRLVKEAQRARRLRNVALWIGAVFFAMFLVIGWFRFDAMQVNDALEKTNRDLARQQKLTEERGEQAKQQATLALRAQARFLTSRGAQIAAAGDPVTGGLYAIQAISSAVGLSGSDDCTSNSPEASCLKKFSASMDEINLSLFPGPRYVPLGLPNPGDDSKAPLVLLRDSLEHRQEMALVRLAWGLSGSDLRDCRLYPAAGKEAAPFPNFFPRENVLGSASASGNVLRPPTRNDLASASYSADGKRLVTRSGNGDQIGVWDIETGVQLRKFIYSDQDAVPLLSPMPGDDRLFVKANGAIYVSGSRSTECPTILRLREWVHSMAISPDGRLLAAASAPATSITKTFDGQHWMISDPSTGLGKLSVVDSADGKSVVEIPLKLPIYGVAFDPKSGHRRLLGVSLDQAQLWDLDHPDQPVVLAHGNIFGAIFSPDGRWILTTSLNETRVWDAQSGTLVYKYEFRLAKPPPVGTEVTEPLTGCLEPRPRPMSADCPTALNSPVGEIAAPFSADGQRLLMIGAPPTNLDEIADGLRLLMTDVSQPEPDVITEYRQYGELQILDLTTMQVSFRHRVAGEWTSAALSPDGKHVAIAGTRGSLWIWNPEQDDELLLRGHSEEIETASFSPDSGSVVTSSADDTARTWRIEVNFKAPSPLDLGQSFMPLDASAAVKLFEDAKRAMPRCLTPDQLSQAFLEAEPPKWCVAMKKWPYDTQLRWANKLSLVPLARSIGEHDVILEKKAVGDFTKKEALGDVRPLNLPPFPEVQPFARTDR